MMERELIDVLDGWQGERVSVRVVTGADDLVAVFAGTLGAQSGAKGPAHFWPVDPDGPANGSTEQPGFYAHPELLAEVRVHTGGLVVEFRQGEATTNVRRLDH